MADDALVPKLFNYICESGGFVALADLLKPSSPLGSTKAKLEAKEWLKAQGPEVGFVCVKDHDDEITGVRIDLRKKICHQYAVKGSCRRGQGKCKYWHICKSYIEGICDGNCGLSHNFHSEENKRKLRELGLEKHSNGTVRSNVAWSLPQVCQLYLRNECKSDKCPYLHVCSQVIQGALCKCFLSHNLSDSHNIAILKQYDLVPPHQIIYVNFVRCSILVLNEQKCIETRKCVVNYTTAEVVHDFMHAVVNNEKQDTGCSLGGSKQDPPATLSSVASPAEKLVNSGLKAEVLFKCLCIEFNCSAPFTVLKKRKYVNELQDALLFLEDNKDKFLFTRNENDNIQDIIAFYPKLRLCFDFVFLNECKKEHCPSFHLCKNFITGSCSHGETCSRGHSFRNKRDQETVSKLDLDWLTNEQLRQLMLSSSPQVCISYNKGTCTNDFTCSRVHICKDFVLNACKNGDACRFHHKRAFDTHHTRLLLEKFQISQKNVMKTILVCEEQDSGPCIGEIMKIQRETSLLLGMQDVQDSPISLQSSHQREPSDPWTDDDQVSSLTSSSSVTGCFPTEREVFECLCKEYGSSASISDIADEQTHLFPYGLKSAETWFRKLKGRFLITEDSKGKIKQVHAFSAQARLCLDYSNNGKCNNQECTYLHMCPDYITDSCNSGVTCQLNHQFHNQRDKALLSRIKLDQFTDLQLQMLVLSSTPQICVKYNNGVCKRGDSCTKIHMCRGYLQKCCGGEYECGLDHERAMDTDQTQAVLKRLMLDNVGKHDLLKMILDDKVAIDLLGEDNTKCHIHEDKPDASICSQFLIGKCQKGVSCENHHWFLPYRWQYTCTIFDEWKSFSEKDNLTLEKLYCDVNLETQANLKHVQSLPSLDGPRFGREKSLPRIQGYEVTIDLDNMTIKFQKPSGGDVASVGLLRRLSTVPYVPAICPCEERDANSYVPSHWSPMPPNAQYTRVMLDTSSAEFKDVEQLFRKTRNDRTVIKSIERVQNPLLWKKYCRIRENTMAEARHNQQQVNEKRLFHGTSPGSVEAICKNNFDPHLRKNKDTHGEGTFFAVNASYSHNYAKKDVDLSQFMFLAKVLVGPCISEYRRRTIFVVCENNRFYPEYIIKYSLAPRASPLRSPPALPLRRSSHIHEDKPDASICSQFLIGKCRKGFSCENHHCFLPYHWQYKGSIFDEWKSFSEKDNLTLEKLYCDVSLEKQVNFKPAQSLEVSRLEREEYEVTIDLDNMTITFQKPSGGDAALVGLLRRLSTVSYIYATSPCHPASTNWKWYWKDDATSGVCMTKTTQVENYKGR